MTAGRVPIPASDPPAPTQSVRSEVGTAESFGAMLRRLRQQYDGESYGNRFGPTRLCLSLGALARLIGVDTSYLSLLERGERTNPARDVVLAIARTLNLGSDETDHLLFTAGLAPETDWQARAEDAERRMVAIADLLGIARGEAAL